MSEFFKKYQNFTSPQGSNAPSAGCFHSILGSEPEMKPESLNGETLNSGSTVKQA